MADIIQVLPDSVANQIAAGEVIQRPASVVKELLENAVDAGATHIKLIIKDAGKSLVQIIDNGNGMSQTDARLSLERHATSKIKSADDLFVIKSFGFRGEALASIVSISHFEMKSRRSEDEIGTQIICEGSDLVTQQATQCAKGTSIAVKNLFFNIPARRKFLKSDKMEVKHIYDEFYRVALPNPHIAFSFYLDDKEVFHLASQGLKQRIISLFGKSYNENLVPVEAQTSIVNVSGFVSKPEFSKRTRGEQYFFVNKRFIKSTYLNHAVQSAYEDLLPSGCFPSYFLLLEMQPASIDVNIHPTKTEIKFEDEKAIYAIMRSLVKQGLGMFVLTPSLDFDTELSFTPPTFNTEIKAPTIEINPDFNPFHSDKEKSIKSPYKGEMQQVTNSNWESLFKGLENVKRSEPVSLQLENEKDTKLQEADIFFQLNNKFIVSPIRSGLLLVHQNRAHERILYETFLAESSQKQVHAQQLLYPQKVELSAGDASLVSDLLQDFQQLGLAIENFGNNTFVVNALPAETANANPIKLIESMLEIYKHSSDKVNMGQREKLALSLAKSTAVKSGQKLSKQEMLSLFNRLFLCNIPNLSPSGHSILHTIKLDDIEAKF